MRVVIIDDEQPARERLRRMLKALPEVEVVGEAEDGIAAIERILQLRPDLALLDIQMPGCSGMEVANSLPSPRPRIVFCTAFDQYAVDAFEVQAIDYLLKPVQMARLAEALDRARRADGDAQQVHFQTSTETMHLASMRFLAKRNARFRVVEQQDVLYFASENGMTILHTRNERYIMEPTLNDFERRLEEADFRRISRNAIVNLNWVKEVAPLIGGYGEVTLKNGVRLEVSRRRFRELLVVLNSGM